MQKENRMKPWNIHQLWDNYGRCKLWVHENTRKEGTEEKFNKTSERESALGEGQSTFT